VLATTDMKDEAEAEAGTKVMGAPADTDMAPPASGAVRALAAAGTNSGGVGTMVRSNALGTDGVATGVAPPETAAAGGMAAVRVAKSESGLTRASVMAAAVISFSCIGTRDAVKGMVAVAVAVGRVVLRCKACMACAAACAAATCADRDAIISVRASVVLPVE
jgi:hypothetical protein